MKAPKDLGLSRHFSLSEFAAHDGVFPPSNSVDALRALCIQVLEPMRARFGVCTVVSGYRGEQRNREVGGAADSRHLYRRHPDSPAADVVFATGSPEQWTALAVQLRVGGIGTYRGHVHLDQRRGRSRWTG